MRPGQLEAGGNAAVFYVEILNNKILPYFGALLIFAFTVKIQGREETMARSIKHRLDKLSWKDFNGQHSRKDELRKQLSLKDFKGQRSRKGVLQKHNRQNQLPNMNIDTAEIRRNRMKVIRSIQLYPFHSLETTISNKSFSDGRNDFMYWAFLTLRWKNDHTLTVIIQGDNLLPFGEVDITQRNSILSIRCNCRSSSNSNLCKHSIFVLRALAHLFYLEALEVGEININRGAAANKSELVEQLQNDHSINFSCRFGKPELY